MDKLEYQVYDSVGNLVSFSPPKAAGIPRRWKYLC